MDRVTKISACLVVACLLHPCCASAEILRPGLYVASATWSGAADGSGGDGGAACGYQPGAVGQPPFFSMTTAGSESIFQSGMGCGSCYAVKCTNHASCSTRPVIVVLTYNTSYGLQAPISLLLTSSSVEKLAKYVIPVGWQPGRTYRAVVNY